MPMFKITRQIGNPDFACEVCVELATMCFVSYTVANTKDSEDEREIDIAIRTALSLLQCHLIKFTRAVILRDFRATLLAVVPDNNPITQDVLDCRHDLKNLSSLGKTIVLQWVAAHCGIPGNEKSDFLAKRGVLVMPKVSRPLSFHSIKNLWGVHDRTL
ncbi:hypothetical protein TNCV_4702041 [Trichonephila clavipes]|uniref:RNase H type-1 domain-containing protein n=1 Tax=Trichonephila clavipes TaxID=2585209 RepID=A0A8X6WGT7_TRICX|nr:hypothetical protein TNCV_4702041 [Trichonephila clavipes]